MGGGEGGGRMGRREGKKGGEDEREGGRGGRMEGRRREGRVDGEKGESEHIIIVMFSSTFDFNDCGSCPHNYLWFCGEVIAGLSLISSSVMKMQHQDKPDKWIHVLLPKRSLYIMRYVYMYSHWQSK